MCSASRNLIKSFWPGLQCDQLPFLVFTPIIVDISQIPAYFTDIYDKFRPNICHTSWSMLMFLHNVFVFYNFFFQCFVLTVSTMRLTYFINVMVINVQILHIFNLCFYLILHEKKTTIDCHSMGRWMRQF